MERNDLLESYLRQLRLPGFARYYQRFATDAARSQPGLHPLFTRFGRAGSE